MELNAAALVDARRAEIQHDQEIMEARPTGYPRGAWREEHPFRNVPRTLKKKRGRKELFGAFAGGHDFIFTIYSGSDFVESIDLRAPDADARLANYVAV